MDQLEYKGIYNKVLLKTKVKSLKYIDINRKYKRYKDFY